jgi:hypothetical protein
MGFTEKSTHGRVNQALLMINMAENWNCLITFKWKPPVLNFNDI